MAKRFINLFIKQPLFYQTYDWQDPARRIFTNGEIALGCNDLDGTTVGKRGQFSINHLKKSDFIDGPDCFVDRKMNANICPMVQEHSDLTVRLQGRNANWHSVNNHWLIQKHAVIHNDNNDWTTFVTKAWITKTQLIFH